MINASRLGLTAVEETRAHKLQWQPFQILSGCLHALCQLGSGFFLGLHLVKEATNDDDAMRTGRSGHQCHRGQPAMELVKDSIFLFCHLHH